MDVGGAFYCPLNFWRDITMTLIGLLRLVLIGMGFLWALDLGQVSVRKQVGENIPSTWYEKLIWVVQGPISIFAVMIAPNGTVFITIIGAVMTGLGLILAMHFFFFGRNDKDRAVFTRYTLYSGVTAVIIIFLNK